MGERAMKKLVIFSVLVGLGLAGGWLMYPPGADAQGTRLQCVQENKPAIDEYYNNAQQRIFNFLIRVMRKLRANPQYNSVRDGKARQLGMSRIEYDRYLYGYLCEQATRELRNQKAIALQKLEEKCRQSTASRQTPSSSYQGPPATSTATTATSKGQTATTSRGGSPSSQTPSTSAQGGGEGVTDATGTITFFGKKPK
jgi:hypothetical protein